MIYKIGRYHFTWLESIFSLLFISYIGFGLGFYGFKGYTWIPQIIGAFLALIFTFYIVYTKLPIIIEETSMILLSFLAYISISIFLFFPEHYLYVTSISQMILLYIITINLIGKYDLVYSFFAGVILSCCILIGNRIASFSPTEISQFMGRVGSTAGNQNDYGFILASSANILLFAKVYLTENKRGNMAWQIVLSTIIIIVALECIIFSGSRTGTVVVLFSSLCYFIYLFIRSKVIFKILQIVVGLVLISLLKVYAASIPVYYRFLAMLQVLSGSSNRDESSGRRLELIEIGLYRWSQKPLFGHGTGQLRYINLDNTYAHNNYAELLANNGIVGLLLFYSIHAVIVISSFRLWSKTQKAHFIFIVVIIFTLLIADMGMVSYYNKVYYVVVAFVAGILYKEGQKYTSVYL